MSMSVGAFSTLNKYGVGATKAFLTRSSSIMRTKTDDNDDDQEKKVHIGSPLAQQMRFRGKVDSGYGRGGKKLGVPTANLPESLFSSALKDVATGVYFGWAVIEDSSDDGTTKKGRNQIHKAVVNVGYSPTFAGEENKEKIIEAHLILDNPETDMEGDFYHETMRLLLTGFLRPEQKFDSFPDLIAQINLDIACAKEALTTAKPYVDLKEDAFFASDDTIWLGKDGGDELASWEFVDQTIILS